MKNKADSRKRTTFASIFKLGFCEKPINILWLILLSLLLSLLPSLEIYMMEILVDKINQLVPYSQIISVLIIYIALFYFAPQLFSNVKSVIKMSINYLLDISLRIKNSMQNSPYRNQKFRKRRAFKQSVARLEQHQIRFSAAI